MGYSSAGIAEAVLLCLAALVAVMAPARADELVLVSGDWHPYVDSERSTDAEQVVANLLALEGDAVRWEYPGFYFATERLRHGAAEAGFPYFKTEARAGEFLFSDPVLEVDNVVIYNQRRNEFQSAPVNLADPYWRGRKIGAVAGYSYAGLEGYDAAEATSYGSERRALAALLRGDIDLLPVERNVWRSLMLRHFPNQFYQIRELPGAGWTEGIHLIMPETPENRARIAAFNERLARFFASNPEVDFDYPISEIAIEVGRGTAQLEGTQLLPLVLGYSGEAADPERTIVIPEGTSVIVTDWADAYFDHRANVPVVRLLQGLSSVLIVSGPHIGREVYVRNAHIRIR